MLSALETQLSFLGTPEDTTVLVTKLKREPANRDAKSKSSLSRGHSPERKTKKIDIIT